MCTGLALFWNRDGTDISEKDSLWFDAIRQTQAMIPHGTSSARISTIPSKEEAITSYKDLPDTQNPSLPGCRAAEGQLAGAARKRGAEQQVLLSDTHLVFSGSRGPPVPNFSCLLRTSRGGFAAEFTNAILATLPVGGQRETLLTSNLLSSHSKLQPALPSPSIPKLWQQPPP